MILLFAAGVLQLLIAAANLPLTRMLDFRREHQRLSPLVRQIHEIHHFYLMGLLGVFALLSFAFADELRGGGALGRFLSITLAVFWGLRLVVQRFYYDRETLRRHRGGDFFFSAVFTFLAVVYAASAAGALR